MEADRALLLQVKKQIYNQNYAQKKKQQQQSQEIVPKKLGRPPSIQVSKAVLTEFQPKPRGRPAQSVQRAEPKLQQVPQEVVGNDLIHKLAKTGSGYSGGGCSGGGCSVGSKNSKGSKLTGGSRPNQLGC